MTIAPGTVDHNHCAWGGLDDQPEPLLGSNRRLGLMAVVAVAHPPATRKLRSADGRFVQLR
jgi:hypothetical protein